MVLVAAVWFFFLVIDIWGVISNAAFPHETLKEWREERFRAAVEADANTRLKRKATKGKEKATKGKERAKAKDKGKGKARAPSPSPDDDRGEGPSRLDTNAHIHPRSPARHALPANSTSQAVTTQGVHHASTPSAVRRASPPSFVHVTSTPLVPSSSPASIDTSYSSPPSVNTPCSSPSVVTSSPPSVVASSSPSGDTPSSPSSVSRPQTPTPTFVPRPSVDSRLHDPYPDDASVDETIFLTPTAPRPAELPDVEGSDNNAHSPAVDSVTSTSSVVIPDHGLRMPTAPLRLEDSVNSGFLPYRRPFTPPSPTISHSSPSRDLHLTSFIGSSVFTSTSEPVAGSSRSVGDGRTVKRWRVMANGTRIGVIYEW